MSGTEHAFLYSNGVMVDLNTLIDPNLQITLAEARGINDLGQIVVNGNGHAYLLTPVPEPGTWVLLGAGLLCSSLCWPGPTVGEQSKPRTSTARG